MKLLREPLVHFLAIGAAIFLVNAYWGQPEAEEGDRTITITAGEIEWLSDSWEKRWTRPPTPEEREGIINQYLKETILYREALAMGLDRNDVIIRRRLAQKLEFLTQDLVSLKTPTESELRAYFENHMDRYRAPDLITMTHVFLDPDKRGDRTLKDAETVKAQLAALKQPPPDARSFGDQFMLQSYYPERSEVELSKLFGRGFAQPLFALAPRQWHGPVLSGYGVHLVYVHDLQKASPPTFAEVEAQVRQDWEDHQRKQLNDQYLASLMARYEVAIEEVPIDEKTAVSEGKIQ